MPNFTCVLCGNRVQTNAVKMVWVGEEMKPKDAVFCSCGGECEIEKQTGTPTVSHFASLSNEQKRKIITDRARKHDATLKDSINEKNQQTKKAIIDGARDNGFRID